MTRFTKLRQNAGRQIDRLEACADSLEAQLERTKESAFAIVDARKKDLSASADRFKGFLGEAQGLAEDKREALQQRLDHLRVQLALGKAEGRDAFRAQKKEIRDDLTRFQDQVVEYFEAMDAVGDEIVDEVADDFAAAADALDAELDAAELQFELEKEGVREKLAAKKAELVQKVHSFKAELATRRKDAALVKAAVEADLDASMARVRKAFENPFK